MYDFEVSTYISLAVLHFLAFLRGDVLLLIICYFLFISINYYYLANVSCHSQNT